MVEHRCPHSAYGTHQKGGNRKSKDLRSGCRDTDMCSRVFGLSDAGKRHTKPCPPDDNHNNQSNHDHNEHRVKRRLRAEVSNVQPALSDDHDLIPCHNSFYKLYKTEREDRKVYASKTECNGADQRCKRKTHYASKKHEYRKREIGCS